MENMNVENAASAPASEVESSNVSVSSPEGSEPKSFQEQFSDFVSASKTKKEDEKLATSPQEADGVNEDPKIESKDAPISRKDKDKGHGAEKRISQLTAKNKDYEAKINQYETDLLRVQNYIELIKEENKRLVDMIHNNKGFDEKEEIIRQYQAKETWQKRDQELAQKREAELQQRMQAEERASIANNLRDEIMSAAAEYFDESSKQYAVSPTDIADVMEEFLEQNKPISAKEAARYIEAKRREVWAKRISPPSAPSTSGSRSSGLREKSLPYKYEGASSIEDFLNEQIRLRRGQ